MRPGLIVTALLAAVAVAVGLRHAGSHDEPAVAEPAIEWVHCRDGVECGMLEVPLEHADPAAGTIRLFVARRPAKDPGRRLGTLVYLPGNPGAVATPQVFAADAFGEALYRRFDLVAIDPRGASPGTQVLCRVGPAWFLLGNPLPETDEERAREAERWRAYAEGCDRRSGWLLPHLSTVASARDIEQLRAALGEEQLTLFGQAYGTALASTYATLHPERVRAAVLDGAYDPSAPLERLSVEQAAAAERALASLLAGCARDPACPFHAGGEPFAAFDELVARLEERPLRLTWRRIGAGDALGATVWALATEQDERLLHALAAADRGDPRMLRSLADERLRPAHTATAVACRDRPPDEWELGAAAAAEIHARAPRLARFFTAPGAHACSEWPAEPEPPPRGDAAGAGPALVVGSTGAVATPLAWSRDLADGLDDAALLVAEHGGSDAYFGDDLRCVRRAVDDFLVDLELPEDRTVCRPVATAVSAPATFVQAPGSRRLAVLR